MSEPNADYRTAFAGLTPPYGTITVDPPWQVKQPKGWSVSGNGPLPYSTMTPGEIASLDVAALAADPCHLYLWTVNRYLREAFAVVDGWGFTFSTLLVWCKQPRGIGPGREYTITSEYVLFCKRGNGHGWGAKLPNRVDRTWHEWPRGRHSVKPAGFGDVVESVSPGPYVELFARAPRLGWDHWGYGYEQASANGTPIETETYP